MPAGDRGAREQRRPSQVGAVHRCVRPRNTVAHGPLVLMGPQIEALSVCRDHSPLGAIHTWTLPEFTVGTESESFFAPLNVAMPRPCSASTAAGPRPDAVWSVISNRPP